MAVNHFPRDYSLRILRESEKRSQSELLKALYDIRYSAQKGDESIVYPLLDHVDGEVVASALFTLWTSFNVQNRVTPTIKRLATGDERDVFQMPIQTMAIALLGDLAKKDAGALEILVAVAEDRMTVDVPRKRAWQCLAELYGVEWLSEYTEEMILAPDSQKSEEVRDKIRRAIAVDPDFDKRANRD